MKKTKLVLLVSVIAILQSCIWPDQSDDVVLNPQSDYTPTILKRPAFEATTGCESPKPIVNSGKIYVKGQFLFVNEKNEGFHVFDNSNPENPINIGFLNVLGSSDLAIKDNIIYVNNAVDLIAIEPNFSNSTIAVTKRIPNTFPQLFSPDGVEYYDLEDDDIIVNWTLNN